VSGLDALSPEEKDVLAVWNLEQINAEAGTMREYIANTKPSHDCRPQRWEAAKARVEKSLARLSRLLGEPK
jgi:hypothetical protein